MCARKNMHRMAQLHSRVDFGKQCGTAHHSPPHHSATCTCRLTQHSANLHVHTPTTITQPTHAPYTITAFHLPHTLTPHPNHACFFPDTLPFARPALPTTGGNCTYTYDAIHHTNNTVGTAIRMTSGSRDSTHTTSAAQVLMVSANANMLKVM